jgi:hypothetical protein
MPYRRLVEWLRQSNCRPIVVASYPRSGTHLLIDCLRLNFTECRSWKFPLERINRLYLNLADLAWKKEQLSARVVRRILSRAERPVIKSHTWPDFRADVSDHERLESLYRDVAEWLQDHAAFLYVYRDGRRVMASRHRTVSRGATAMGHVSLGEFLRQSPLGVSRPRAWAQQVSEWLAQPRVHAVAMERLLAEPAVVLRDIGAAFGLTPLLPRLRLPARNRLTWPARLGRLIAVHPSSTAIVSKTPPLDWRSALTRADRAFFHAEAGDVLLRLGYERSADWVDHELPAEVSA